MKKIQHKQQKISNKISKENFSLKLLAESLLNYVHKEIPYKCLIITNDIKTGKFVTINQTIIVRTNAHKKNYIRKEWKND